LKTAIRGNNPTFFMEAGGRGGEQGEVPDGDILVPFGKAAIARAGKDATIVAIGSMLKPALAAAKNLAASGVDAEVIDPRTLMPFDEATVLTSVQKTGRLVVCDEARDYCSVASQIAAIVADKGFGFLQQPIKRVTVPNTCLPYAPQAEARLIPNADAIARVTRELVV
jgi:pyruvate dehydrogenase E1 component beta subunit